MNEIQRLFGIKPKYYGTPEEMNEKIIEYFQSFIDSGKEIGLGNRPTLTGLALFLGFTSRQSLYDYKKREEYTEIIERATLYVEMSYENQLGEKNVAGAVFALKNMGWRDKQEVVATNANYNAPLTKEELENINKDLENEY